MHKELLGQQLTEMSFDYEHIFSLFPLGVEGKEVSMISFREMNVRFGAWLGCVF